MKQSFLILALLVLFATIATAASPADTTFTPTKGTICLFGKVLDGKDISLTVKGLKVVVNTPGATITAWELPDPTTPSPTSPESREKHELMDAIIDNVQASRQENLSQTAMKLHLAAFKTSFCDSVIPTSQANVVLVYWKGDSGPEVLEVAGGSNVEDKARATPESCHRALTIYVKNIVDVLNLGAVVFMTIPTSTYSQPGQLTFREENKKKEALFEVIRVLQGNTEGLHLLNAKVVSELRSNQ